MGVEDSVILEAHVHTVLPGDVYLACSDGLSDMLPDAQMAQVLQAVPSLDMAARALVDAANEAGGRDNISVVLARAPAGATSTPRPWWPFRR